MGLSKQLKDILYQLLQEPTLEKFREFLHAETGEHNSIDFKKKWIENSSLVKEMLSMANSKGGVLVFGVEENEDKSMNITGLEEIKDKVDISNDIKNFISSNLKYEVYNFVYDTSEYDKLIGKKFQMLVIEDTPEHIPFLSHKDSGSLKQNTIYVRRGTACETANEEELQDIFNRRINYLHPKNGEPLQLDEHLKQLEILYDNIDEEDISYENGVWSTVLETASNLFMRGEKVVKKNPEYPSEEYDEFVSRMITAKKKKIERVLDLY